MIFLKVEQGLLIHKIKAGAEIEAHRYVAQFEMLLLKALQENTSTCYPMFLREQKITVRLSRY